MTVEELIKELEEFPKDYEVCVMDTEEDKDKPVTKVDVSILTHRVFIDP